MQGYPAMLPMVTDDATIRGGARRGQGRVANAGRDRWRRRPRVREHRRVKELGVENAGEPGTSGGEEGWGLGSAMRVRGSCERKMDALRVRKKREKRERREDKGERKKEKKRKGRDPKKRK